jgi:hypothetical protein
MSEVEKKSVEPKKPKVARCEFPECRKKLGLVGFDCRCGHHYCPDHRFSESHACTFDYRQEAKKELLKYMSSPIVGPKIAII